MWYPEEPVTYCRTCDLDIPVDCFWRGSGYIISSGRQVRTRVLYSLCPGCGRKQSVGLDGPWYFRFFYAWVWQLRYPRTRRPRLDFYTDTAAVEKPRRRLSGS